MFVAGRGEGRDSGSRLLNQREEFHTDGVRFAGVGTDLAENRENPGEHRENSRGGLVRSQIAFFECMLLSSQKSKRTSLATASVGAWGWRKGMSAMSVTGAPIRLFATLLLFWLLLSASLTIESVVIGALIAGLVAVTLGANLSYLSGYRFTAASLTATVLYVGYFLVQLVKSNLAMATLVLKPSLPVHPAIVRVRTGLKNPIARLLLANSITLTPGTLSVEMKGEWLYIHWVVAEATEVDAATRAIAAGFERYLEVMYG